MGNGVKGLIEDDVIIVYDKRTYANWGNVLQAPKDKCLKCKTVHDGNQPCTVAQHPYKCPICDVVSANAAESRRHIETHGGVKAFRCSMCGYKGNTLR